MVSLLLLITRNEQVPTGVLTRLLSHPTLEVALLIRLIDEIHRVNEEHIHRAAESWYGLRYQWQRRRAILVCFQNCILKIRLSKIYVMSLNRSICDFILK